MKETILYCGKTKEGYSDFFKNTKAVKMCGIDEQDIVKVKVRESLKNETPTHYAWWDNTDNEFQFIYKTRIAVDICFPYGSKTEEELGNGEIYGIVVEEINI